MRSDAIASNVGGIPSGPVKNTWIDQLEIRELRFERIKAKLTELNHIENRSSIKVLGVEIFKEFSMTIDLQQNVLILKKLNKRGNELSQLESQTAAKTMKIPIKIVNNTIMLQGVVAGNFNGWNGITMDRKGDVWKVDVYLPPGKCLYKFVVDGIWILDPANDQWEDNEFHNGNSVRWVTNNQ